MATAEISYAAAAAITITLASLASSATAGRESTAVDNTSNKYVDAIVGGTIKAGTTPTVSTQIEVWVYGSYDGTNYAANATGSDAAFTPAQQSKTYMRLGAILPTTVNTTGFVHKFIIGSVANLFGGVMPQKWGVFVIHNSVAALDSTAGSHEIDYVGVKYTSA